jgi:hypothetical protein
MRPGGGTAEADAADRRGSPRQGWGTSWWKLMMAAMD